MVSYVFFHAFTTVRGAYAPAGRPLIFITWIFIIFIANNEKLLPGASRKAQSAGRKANNTINAVRQAPCAMRLPPGRRRQSEQGEK
jgi:hypothetical protein